MIKVEVLENFTFGKYDEIKDTLLSKSNVQQGKLFAGDIFDCNKEIADYLLGNNPIKRAVVKVIEIIPEKEKKEITKKQIKSKKLLQKNSDYGNI